jgi:hypothetical protein
VRLLQDRRIGRPQGKPAERANPHELSESVSKYGIIVPENVLKPRRIVSPQRIQVGPIRRLSISGRRSRGVEHFQ